MKKKFKWSKKQVKALEGSILKWDAIVNKAAIDMGIDNCPCCTAWFRAWNDSRAGKCCAGCPVMKYVGKSRCEGTPYEDWVKNGGSFGTSVSDEKGLKLAKRELAFLKNVLKAGINEVKR